jgi:hypothetical protein
MRGKITKIVAFCQNNNVKEIINIEAKAEIKADVEVERFLTLVLTFLQLSILLLHLQTLWGFSSVG